MALRQGQPEQAHQFLMTALDSLRQLEDRREVALTLHELGTLASQQGQQDEADQLLTEALATMRQLRDRGNAAQTLKELGMLARQRGQLEEALHLLLTAQIGLTLVRSPDASTIEKMLGQMRAQLGEDMFNSIARQVAGAVPEVAYGLDQGEWEAVVGKLSAMVHAH
jgi:tetratricopeptide (TPR) repeat protein